MNLIDLIHDLIHGHPDQIVSIVPYQELFKIYPPDFNQPFLTLGVRDSFRFSPPDGYQWEILYVVHEITTGGLDGYRESRLYLGKKEGPITEVVKLAATLQRPSTAMVHVYMPSAAIQNLNINYRAGQIGVVPDHTVNDNDKTITVPANCLWNVESIRIYIVCSGTAGNRIFAMALYDPLGVTVLSLPTVLLAASQTQQVIVTPSSPWIVGAAGGTSVLGLGLRYWPAGYYLRIWDTANISALDDIFIDISRTESYSLGIRDITPIPKIVLSSAIDSYRDELVIYTGGATDIGTDTHLAYIGVRESRL